MTGQELRFIRRGLGWSQSAMARALGYSSGQVIWRKEMGRSSVTTQDELLLRRIIAESNATASAEIDSNVVST